MSETLLQRNIAVYLQDGRDPSRTVVGEVVVGMQDGNGPTKVLTVQLTHPDEPIFFYTYELTEEAFMQLRAEQGLLVDFKTFPHHLLEMLLTCASEAEKPSPRFLLKIVIGANRCDHRLLIVEANAFRHLVHLSLPLHAASDQQLRGYLVACVRHWKTAATQLSTQLQETNGILTERENEVKRLSASNTAALEVEREKHRRQQDQAQQEYSSLTATKNKLEGALREARTKLNSVTEELLSAQSEMEALRGAKQQMDGAQQTTQRTLDVLQSKIATLEHELNRREEARARLETALATATEQKGKAEAELSGQRAHVAKLEAGAAFSAQEMTKANDLIRRLRDELVSSKEKLKMVGAVNLQQERLLEQKQKGLEQLGAELGASKQWANEMGRELEATKRALAERDARLEECRQMLSTNETVIAWLNKQISDATGGKHPQPGPPMMAAPRPMQPPRNQKPTTAAASNKQGMVPAYAGRPRQVFASKENVQQ
eukprot:comp20202_c0_seq1/m.25098 comp20202_c0_seq1/g.25098  ORF comp20202_c0_seq1/g.25098 comp20202_c0_seq1/m.25098 type:complete len:488 (-) comp20202_c0_seq1:109-1572(-)